MHQVQQHFQQMQQVTQYQQQFNNNPGNSNNGNIILSAQSQYHISRRGRRPTDRRKRKRHTWVKRPTTAYLYFVSKYRETLKEAGEVVPKVRFWQQFLIYFDFLPCVILAHSTLIELKQTVVKWIERLLLFQSLLYHQSLTLLHSYFC